MRKTFKKVLAAALVLTLAVPSAITLAADDSEKVELPTPLAQLTMQEANLEENGYQNVAGTEAVKDDKMGTVLHVNASTEADGVWTDSEASFKNPFVGQDFSELDVQVLNETLKAENEAKIAAGEDPILDENEYPIWYKGVVINYWVKATTKDNSVILNFRNKDRLQVQKDDWAKHVALQWAAQAAEDEKAGKEIDERFDFSEPVVYVDGEGKEYNVYETIGQWAPYREDFPEDAYQQSGSGTIIAHPKDGEGDVKLAPVTKYYEMYKEVDYDKNEKSDVRYGLASGFLQTAMDGGFVYVEDTNNNKGVNPNPQLNPNKNSKDEAGEMVVSPLTYNGNNNVKWAGTLTTTLEDGTVETESAFMDEALADNEETANWHMITVQIQNDSVVYYIDGNPFNDEGMEDFYSFGAAWPGTAGIGKNFNGGWGYKFPYGKGISNRNGWYGNMCGALMLDWLSMDNTTFSIGGTNLEVSDTEGFLNAVAFDNPERVAEFYIDDVTFYGEMLDQDQIDQLYENGLEKMAMENPDEADPTEVPENQGNGDVDGEPGVNSSDALLVLKFAAKLENPTPEQIAAADTNLDGKVNADDALNILKFAAKLIPSLPVQE